MSVSPTNGKSGVPSDLVKLFIQIGGLLVTLGVLYQTIQDSKTKTVELSATVQDLQRTMQRDVSDIKRDIAVLGTRLQMIEERQKEAAK